MNIIRAEKRNIESIAEIASSCFSGLRDVNKAKKWVTCNFEAFPRMQYFVAEDNEVLGYILWTEKGGFREEAVFELEQIAVKPTYQGSGIGTKLIQDSLLEIKKYLTERGSSLKIIEVTTGTENQAQKLYRKTLGAEVEATIRDLFRGDEVIMIRRYK